MGAISNRSRLSIVKEVTKGTTPASPSYRILRQTSNGLATTQNFVESEEIISSRKLGDYILVGRDIGGPIGVEWCYDAHDDLLEGAMMSAWEGSGERNGTTEITATSSTAGSSYTVTSIANRQFAQYHLIRASGFPEAANNRLFAAVTGTTNTNVAAAAGGAAGTGGATARLKQIGFEGPSGDIQAAASALTATVLSFLNMNVRNGQWIYIGGNTLANRYNTAANQGYARISYSTAITATNLPLDVLPTGWVVDAGASKTIRVYFTDFIVDGTTENSYSIERFRSDITFYETFRGVLVDSFSLDGVADDKVNGEFTTIGFGYSATQAASATYRNASQASVFNGASNVAFVALNGTEVRTGLNTLFNMDLRLENNSRKDAGFGSFGGVGTSLGGCRVSGNIGLYFGDGTFTGLSENQTETTLRFGLRDAAGNGLVFDMPRVKLAGAPPGDEGVDVSVVSAFEYRALEFRPALSSLATRQLAISQFEEIGS